jgi:predicted phosphodiesterase/transposase-like protein
MAFTTNEKRLKEVIEYYIATNSMESTCKTFNIKQSTLERYLRQYQNALGFNIEKSKLVTELQQKFTTKELQSILKGSMIKLEKQSSTMDFDGEEFTFGHITDTHIGSIYFRDYYLQSYFEEAEKQGVQCTFHTGDLTEGMSHRPGHVYSLSEIGYDAQKEKTIELFKDYKKPIKIIDGNHDRWYLKSNGALIVKDIAREFSNWEYLGHDNATVEVNGVKIELHHGEDGSSYATSYRVQKVIEAMRGGEKPQILLTGHTHKMVYMFERNIHAISGGALSWLSAWMKSKRLVCHTGFWIVKCVIAEGEVKSLSPRWYPFYVR